MGTILGIEAIGPCYVPVELRFKIFDRMLQNIDGVVICTFDGRQSFDQSLRDQDRGAERKREDPR